MVFSLWRAFFAYGIISSISTERITYLQLCQEKRSGGEICYAAGVLEGEAHRGSWVGCLQLIKRNVSLNRVAHTACDRHVIPCVGSAVLQRDDVIDCRMVGTT